MHCFLSVILAFLVCICADQIFGAIAGGTVLAFVALAILVAICAYCVWYKHKKKDKYSRKCYRVVLTSKLLAKHMYMYMYYLCGVFLKHTISHSMGKELYHV